MIALLICLAVLTVGGAALLGARHHEALRAQRQRIAAEQELARSGLTPTVGTYSWALAGVKEGVQLSLESFASRPLPGSSPGREDSIQGTLLLAQAPGAEVIVCRRDLTDAIAGPLSTVPKLPTGDEAFDAGYDVLSADASFDARVFPPPSVRRALMAAGLVWLRRKEGRLEVMTTSLATNQAVAFSRVGMALCRPDEPRDALPMPVVEITAEAPSLTAPLYTALGSLLLVGPLGAMVLSLFPPVQSLFLDLGCPAGFVIEGVSSSDGSGSSYGAICRHGTDWQELSALFFLACGLLTSAITLSAGLFFSALRGLVRQL